MPCARQQILLEGGQGSPPLAPRAVVVAAAGRYAPGQVAPDRLETDPLFNFWFNHRQDPPEAATGWSTGSACPHQRRLPRLRRITAAQRPRDTKFTSMAERP
jgi:hypothetical protein